MNASPISPIANQPLQPGPIIAGSAGPSSGVTSFANLIEHGLGTVSQKLAKAETLAKSFALDDNVPIQQVTLALQEARMSLEFMLQVRTRLVDAYQQFAQMQL